MSNGTQSSNVHEPTVFDTVFGPGAKHVTVPAAEAGFQMRLVKFDVDPEPEDGSSVQLDGAVFEPSNDEEHGPGPYPVVVMPAPLSGFGWRAYFQEPTDEYPNGSGIAVLLAKQGYIVAVYSHRGLAESTGYIDVAGPHDVADGRKVIDWVRDNTSNPDMAKVGLAGASYGAGTSLMIAAHDPRVKAVAALSAWADLYASLYENKTRHMKAFNNLKNLFLGGPGIPRKRLSEKTRMVFENYVSHEQVEELEAWALERSPNQHLAAYQSNGTAIYLHTYYHETIFNNPSVIELFRNLQQPKRLLAQIGDHGAAEGLGLAGLDSAPTSHLYQWFTRHLKCQGADTLDNVFAERAWDIGEGAYGYPDLDSLENEQQRIYLVKTLGEDGTIRPTPAALETVASFEVGEKYAVSVESAPLVVISGILERLAEPANYNITSSEKPLPPYTQPPDLPDVKPHYEVAARPLLRAHAAVFKEPLDLSVQHRRIVGQPKVHLRVRAEATRITVCVYLLAVLPLGQHARMVTSGVYSYTGAESYEERSIEIPMQWVDHKIPSDRRLMVVVTANDPLYDGAIESVSGTRVEIRSGTLAQGASWLEVPIADA